MFYIQIGLRRNLTSFIKLCFFVHSIYSVTWNANARDPPGIFIRLTNSNQCSLTAIRRSLFDLYYDCERKVIGHILNGHRGELFMQRWSRVWRQLMNRFLSRVSLVRKPEIRRNLSTNFETSIIIRYE